jgi:thiol-disulfide isomerase/thioredoxin
MIRTYVRAAVAAAGIALCTAVALPQTPETPPPAPKKPALAIGDKAPPLSVGKWVQGEAVNQFEAGKCYVVDFWASWSTPCKRSIPHINDLQKKYPDIAMIGVACWEKEKDQSKVEPFVKEMGDKMTYRVATDSVPESAASTNDGAMSKAWMNAAQKAAPPVSFVVDKAGLLAWIGHPMDLDPVLEKVAAGKWDTLAEAKKLQAAGEIKSRLRAAETAILAKKWKEGLENLDAVIALNPALEKERIFRAQGSPGEPINVSRFRCMLGMKDWEKAYPYCSKLIESYKDDDQILNALAWYIVDPEEPIEKKDLEVARKAAARAYELKPESYEIIDTYALVVFEAGEIDKAIELQEKAVALAKGKQFEKDVNDRLAKFKKAKSPQ